MKSLEIRSKFFDFFKRYGHEQVASSSLIPAQDPTLLFANAGMNQFKDVFLGLETRSYKRAVSIQKCVRAGGKHNDLDNVGFTKRHLTFFEMMGNFSFGDYFKKEAIAFAWEFLTKEIKLPIDNLHATVFETDDQSYDLWHKTMGLPTERVHRLGAKDNFWQMGDTGPCGPCTEIHIDRGPEFGCKDITQCGPACDCDRFLEIWNLVFMEFDRQPDGVLKPLKQTGVDTGMGLERLCSVMQNVDSVFLTDLFVPIIHHIEQLTKRSYAKQSPDFKAAFHVLADHIRSSSMLIADGCAPSNEGRGYVLRKIIRRAALFTQKLTTENIFPELSKVVVEHFGTIYPELVTNQPLIFKILHSEIEKFSTNLVRGTQRLEQYIHEHADSKLINGAEAFKLYDTFGFPYELICLIAHQAGFIVDEPGFQQHMKQQQEQSGSKTKGDPLDHLELPETITTEFTGYQELETDSEIIALITGNTLATNIPQNSSCYIIARKSPFFIVGGGQVPDQGWIIIDGHKTPIKEARYINGRIAALIQAPVDMHIGQAVTSIVDTEWRTNAMKNHTATHMLQAALIALFGKQIKQSGSLVHPDYLRFDFTYHENLSPEDIEKVENLVNDKIRENITVSIEHATLKEATHRGVIAFFGDKYNPEQVRIVNIPAFSAELCGGTHVNRTGDIGAFKITEVTALSAGHRRIVAVTGPKAIELFQETFNNIKQIGQEFKIPREQVVSAVIKQKEQVKQLQHQIKQLKQIAWQLQLPHWHKETSVINGMPCLVITPSGMTHEELKEVVKALEKQQAGFYALISEQADQRVLFLATVSPQYVNKVNLNNLATWLKEKFNIRSGVGKNNIQGGAEKFEPNLKQELFEWLKQL